MSNILVDNPPPKSKFDLAVLKVHQKRPLDKSDWEAFCYEYPIYAAFRIAQLTGVTPEQGLNTHYTVMMKLIRKHREETARATEKTAPADQQQQ